MSIQTSISVHPLARVRDAERLAEALGCDLVLAGGRAYLSPREAIPGVADPQDQARAPALTSAPTPVEEAEPKESESQPENSLSSHQSCDPHPTDPRRSPDGRLTHP
jgi:hypothetical protein